MAAMWRNQRYS